MPYDKQTKSRKLYIYLNVLVISKTKKNIYWVSKRIIVRILKFLLLLVINKFLIFIFACLRSTCVAKALGEWEKDSLTTLCRIILYLHIFALEIFWMYGSAEYMYIHIIPFFCIHLILITIQLNAYIMFQKYLVNGAFYILWISTEQTKF